MILGSSWSATRRLSQTLEKGQSFFSECLLLSASVLFLPILYMTAALALLSGVGLGSLGFSDWVVVVGGSGCGVARARRLATSFGNAVAVLGSVCARGVGFEFHFGRGIRFPRLPCQGNSIPAGGGQSLLATRPLER